MPVSEGCASSSTAHACRIASPRSMPMNWRACARQFSSPLCRSASVSSTSSSGRRAVRVASRAPMSGVSTSALLRLSRSARRASSPARERMASLSRSASLTPSASTMSDDRRCSSSSSSSAERNSAPPAFTSRSIQRLPSAVAIASCSASKLFPVPPSPERRVTVRLGIRSSTCHSRAGRGRPAHADAGLTASMGSGAPPLSSSLIP